VDYSHVKKSNKLCRWCKKYDNKEDEKHISSECNLSPIRKMNLILIKWYLVMILKEGGRHFLKLEKRFILINFYNKLFIAIY
jgi:hypothetical protein